MSAQPQYVNIADFMQHLKREGLVIMRADDIEQGKMAAQREAQRKLMRKTAITFGQAIAAGFFPLKSITGLKHWVADGKTFQKGETWKAANGRWMLMTSAIKRLGYAE